MTKQNPVPDRSLLEASSPSDLPEEVWKQAREEKLRENEIVSQHEYDQAVAMDREIEARIAEIKRRPLPKLKYRSKLRQQILLALMEKEDMTDREVCKWLDMNWEDDPPYDDMPFIKVYEGKKRALLASLISKVRADLRGQKAKALQALSTSFL